MMNELQRFFRLSSLLCVQICARDLDLTKVFEKSKKFQQVAEKRWLNFVQ